MIFRALLVSLCLLALWLLISGIYKPLLIGFGVVSCLLVAAIVAHLGLLGRRGMFNDVGVFKLFRYLFWLTAEIGKADWAVAKVILSPELPKRQKLLKVATSQRSDFARMLYANSITITPGTVTVETEDDHFIVHALTDASGDAKGLRAMDERVSKLERPMRRYR